MEKRGNRTHYAIVRSFSGIFSPIIPTVASEITNTHGVRSTKFVFAFNQAVASVGVANTVISKRAPTFVRLRESSAGSTYNSLYSHITNRVSFFTHGTTSPVYFSSGISISSILVKPACAQSQNCEERKKPQV